jgi:hypothetical protein
MLAGGYARGMTMPTCWRAGNRGSALLCERWSKLEGTLPHVQVMLAQVSTELAAAEVIGPRGEDLLLIWHPLEPFSERGAYEVAREHDWIVQHAGASVVVMHDREFRDQYELDELD